MQTFRPAMSQGALQYRDEGVVLASPSASRREIGFIELAYLTYLAKETTLATLLGLRCAAARHGIDMAGVSDLPALGIAQRTRSREHLPRSAERTPPESTSGDRDALPVTGASTRRA